MKLGHRESKQALERGLEPHAMKARTSLSLLLALTTLSGCAYPQYMNDEYRYIPLTNFSHDDRSFRIFDKPSAGRLIITPSLTTAMSDVVIRGATLGEFHNATEKTTLERAVEAYFTARGRKCSVTGSSLIYDPQWEFSYECELRYTATP
jgi:hypothetical protein